MEFDKKAFFSIVVGSTYLCVRCLPNKIFLVNPIRKITEAANLHLERHAPQYLLETDVSRNTYHNLPPSELDLYRKMCKLLHTGTKSILFTPFI